MTLYPQYVATLPYMLITSQALVDHLSPGIVSIIERGVPESVFDGDGGQAFPDQQLRNEVKGYVKWMARHPSKVRREAKRRYMFSVM